MSTTDISTALSALSDLSSSTSTSSSGPLNALLDDHFSLAKKRLLAREDPKVVITDLQKAVTKAKKGVERGLKGWYAALGGVGKAVEQAFPPHLAAISKAYDDPPLFSDPSSSIALDQVILDSLGRRGLWTAVSAFESELKAESESSSAPSTSSSNLTPTSTSTSTPLTYPASKRALSEQLHQIISSIESGDLKPAIEWCLEPDNAAFLASPPHPSPLPYHLHRSVFLSIIPDQVRAIAYAREHLMRYIPTQPVLALVTSCLYPVSVSVPSAGGGQTSPNTSQSPYTNDPAPLVQMFRSEFCRRHSWAKEEPLEVVVDLGSRGGALNAIEKARRVMGDRLGKVRTWDELPMEIPLPASRRYHSVFVCPVSKQQATETNAPLMLMCGHVIAEESFNRLLKGGRPSAKCPYCPVPTSQHAAQTLYF